MQLVRGHQKTFLAVITLFDYELFRTIAVEGGVMGSVLGHVMDLFGCLLETVFSTVCSQSVGVMMQ